MNVIIILFTVNYWDQNFYWTTDPRTAEEAPNNNTQGWAKRIRRKSTDNSLEQNEKFTSSFWTFKVFCLGFNYFNCCPKCFKEVSPSSVFTDGVLRVSQTWSAVFCLFVSKDCSEIEHLWSHYAATFAACAALSVHKRRCWALLRELCSSRKWVCLLTTLSPFSEERTWT